jgi:hypothetical protein
MVIFANYDSAGFYACDRAIHYMWDISAGSFPLELQADQLPPL